MVGDDEWYGVSHLEIWSMVPWAEGTPRTQVLRRYGAWHTWEQLVQ